MNGDAADAPDVHTGVHLQRLIAAVEESLDSGRVVTPSVAPAGGGG